MTITTAITGAIHDLLADRATPNPTQLLDLAQKRQEAARLAYRYDFIKDFTSQEIEKHKDFYSAITPVLCSDCSHLAPLFRNSGDCLFMTTLILSGTSIAFPQYALLSTAARVSSALLSLSILPEIFASTEYVITKNDKNDPSQNQSLFKTWVPAFAVGAFGFLLSGRRFSVVLASSLLSEVFKKNMFIEDEIQKELKIRSLGSENIDAENHEHVALIKNLGIFSNEEVKNLSKALIHRSNENFAQHLENLSKTINNNARRKIDFLAGYLTCSLFSF